MGSSLENIELVKKAKSYGYYTIVCDGYKEGPAKVYGDKAYCIDVGDVNAIVAICEREKVDGIVGSFSDHLAECITYIAEKAGLKWYLDSDQLSFYRDKAAARSLMGKLGLKTPLSETVTAGKHKTIEEGLKPPVVIKPVSGWGSHGILVAETKDEIVEFASGQLLAGERYEAEEYCEAPEYNLNGWIHDGKIYILGIGDREKNPRTANEIPFVNRIVYPAKDMSMIDEAKGILKKYADATGQVEGPISMQFFYDDSIIIGEIAGRLLGFEHELLNFSAGVDVESLLLGYVYDEDKLVTELEKIQYSQPMCFAGLYLMVKEGETVGDMSKLRMLLEDDHCIENRLSFTEGDIVKYGGQVSYFAQIYICGKDRDELDEVTQRFFYEYKVLNERGEEIQTDCRFENR